MIVKHLQLRNFRNYENASMTFDAGLNVITGENAQGKTNLLESLVYLSLTRSHRISDDKKLIKEGMPFAQIKCQFEDEKTKDIEAIIHPQGKTLLVHKNPVKKSSEFVGLLNVVLFAPDDLRIFNDQPRERRRLMNQEITKISPKYLYALNQYQNFLKQRNILLKQKNVDLLYLDTLDERMSDVEKVIIEERKEFIKSINESISSFYQRLSGEDKQVYVRYKTCLEKDITKENVLHMHQEAREKDLENRLTSVGIHREDMIFEIDDRNITEFASQGQKRMMMLSFKLAMLRYIESKTKKKPILLLDDVMSELDLHKQEILLDMVSQPYQCIITTTHIPSYMEKIPMKKYVVRDGNIDVQ